MLQRKDTINISELNSFLTSSEKVCETVLWIIRSLKYPIFLSGKFKIYLCKTCFNRFKFPGTDLLYVVNLSNFEMGVFMTSFQGCKIDRTNLY